MRSFAYVEYCFIAEECDATDDDSSSVAGSMNNLLSEQQNYYGTFLLTHPVINENIVDVLYFQFITAGA